MNSNYLFGGSSVCFLFASIIGLAGSVSPSSYVVGGIILLSFAMAVKYK